MGEQTEHLWADCKPLFLLARYMTPAHWWDCINSVLALLTTLRQQGLPQVLKQKLDNIEKLIRESNLPMFVAHMQSHQHHTSASMAALHLLPWLHAPPITATHVEVFVVPCALVAASCQEALQELAREAAGHGIPDLEATLAAVDASEEDAVAVLSEEVCMLYCMSTCPPPHAGWLCVLLVPVCSLAALYAGWPLHCPVHLPSHQLVVASLQARYVEKLAQYTSQVELRQQKMGLSLLRGRGVDLHAEGGNNKREEELLRACIKHEIKLNIGVGEHSCMGAAQGGRAGVHVGEVGVGSVM